VDPYEILGIAPGASLDDIKRAYRERARALHPDKSGTPESEEAFKVLNAAYRHLTGRAITTDFVVAPPPPRTEPESSVTEIITGLGNLVTKARQAVRGSKGDDIQVEISVPFDEAVTGSTRRLTLDGAPVVFPVPPGTRDGRRLKVTGRGHASTKGGDPGDLLITVRVVPRPGFHLDGDDVHCAVPVSCFEAALGAIVEIPTVSGPVHLQLPAGVQPGSRLTLPGRGVAPKGNQLVTIEVEVPTELPDDARAALRAAARTLPANAFPTTTQFRGVPPGHDDRVPGADDVPAPRDTE
jgi:curved DNA-binding protein